MAKDVLADNETYLDLWDADAYVEIQKGLSYYRVDIIVLSIIFVLALVGNLVVVAVLLWRRFGSCKPRRYSESPVRSVGQPDLSQTSVPFRMTNINWFILFLSFADICVALFTILCLLIWKVTWVFKGNDFLCRIVVYLQVVPSCLATYTVVGLAIDRYISVCHAASIVKPERKRVAILISIAWSLAFIFGIPTIFFQSLKEVRPGLSQCLGTFHPGWEAKLYVVSFAVISFLAPLTILLICYGRISCVIWGHGRHNALSYPTRNSSHQGEGSQTAIVQSGFNPGVQLSLAIILFHIVCRAPNIIFHLWLVFNDMEPFNRTAYLMIMRLANLSSCVNPWIYLVFSALRRRSFVDVEIEDSRETTVSR